MNEIRSTGYPEIRTRCPNCGTLYRVDGAKLRDHRIRARCAVCKGILVIARPARNDGAVVRQGLENPAGHRRPGALERVLLALLEGQRERRETMWHMVREVFRLGEAVEKHHAVLNRAVNDIVSGGGASAADGSCDEADLETLRDSLEEERELVNRLRRARLDIERRAVEAESRLNRLKARKRDVLIAELTPSGR